MSVSRYWLGLAGCKCKDTAHTVRVIDEGSVDIKPDLGFILVWFEVFPSAGRDIRRNVMILFVTIIIVAAGGKQAKERRPCWRNQVSSQQVQYRIWRNMIHGCTYMPAGEARR